MKRLKEIFISITAAACLFSCLPVSAADEIAVWIDNALIVSDVSAQIINDRAMLPFRAIFEELDADVDWNGEYQIITAVKGTTVLNLRIDKPIMVRINLKTQKTEQITLAVPPQIVNDRTMVPVRAVAEALDASVDWEPESRTVKISTQEE